MSAEGELLGKLPPVLAERPWWPEVGSVVRAVREAHGLHVTLLRLLRAERESPPGGKVTYLAEVAGPVSCEPCDETLVDHPLRRDYARPGGPRRDLEWASGVMASCGLGPFAAPEQIKTWNLSSVWRFPLIHEERPEEPGQGSAWLKVVPPFFAHEGALIARLEPLGGVPHVLGFERGRALLAEIPGEDGFHASLEQRRAMIDLLVRLVSACQAQLPGLLALGLPDYRARPLSAAIARSFERHRDELEPGDARSLSRFVDELEPRWRRLAECGLPDGLVHGDFHSGNVRIAGPQLTLLDWGDAGIGHPLLDEAAFLERVPPEQRQPLREHFRAAWQRAIPGCDPARAEQLIAPLAAARQTVIYDQFLDQIEPSEHPYHRQDPLRWLVRAAHALR